METNAKGKKLGKSWKRSIRNVLLCGGEAGAAKMFPTKPVARLSRDEFVTIALLGLESALLTAPRGMKLTAKQIRKEDKGLASAAAKATAAKTVKTAATKSKVTINTGATKAPSKGSKK